jgi:hypothetical protein
LGGELVVFRKTALDREEADERVDRLLHLGEACAKGQTLAIERLIVGNLISLLTATLLTSEG